MYQFQEFCIPDYMKSGIVNYINNGIHPGGFLSAIICNDLTTAVMKADGTNIHNLPAYIAYFYNETPSGCWGSKSKMEKWMKSKRSKYEKT